MLNIAYVLVNLINIYTWVLLIYILMSWVPNKQGTVASIYQMLGVVSEPYLNLFKFIPPIGGMVDINPIIAFFVLQLLKGLIVFIF